MQLTQRSFQPYRQRSPVRVLLIDTIEQLQQAAAHITRDLAHHTKVIVYQATSTGAIYCYVARMRICSQLSAFSQRCDSKTPRQTPVGTLCILYQVGSITETVVIKVWVNGTLQRYTNYIKQDPPLPSTAMLPG